MGKKDGKKKKKTGQNEENGTVTSTATPPEVFEIPADSTPPTSEPLQPKVVAPIDPVLSEHLELFPWSSLRKAPLSEEERLEDLQLRTAAASTLFYPDIGSLLPMVKRLEVYGSILAKDQPFYHPLILASLTMRMAMKLESMQENTVEKRTLLDLPPHLFSKIADYADANSAMKLTCYKLLTALNEDIDSDKKDSIASLVNAARANRLYLDEKKLRKSGAFNSNWFGEEKEDIEMENVVTMRKMTRVGCTPEMANYIFVRNPECRLDEPAEIRWTTSLCNKGIPLWVFENIRPQISCKFRYNYEPGDKEIECKMVLLSPSLQKCASPMNEAYLQRIGPHIGEYTGTLTNLSPLYTSNRAHNGVKLGLIITLPNHREDFIIWNIEIRCALPKKNILDQRLTLLQVDEATKRGTQKIRNEEALFPTSFQSLDPTRYRIRKAVATTENNLDGTWENIGH